MTLTMTPLHPVFAAEISGIDLRRPADAKAQAAVIAAMDRYAVCVFRHQQPLTDDQHVAFSRLFGPLQMRTTVRPGRPPRLKAPELNDAGNIDENDAIIPAGDKRRLYNLGNTLWHTDGSFNAIRPTYSLLSAHLVPAPSAEGKGETEFADLRAAYDALPEAMRRRIEPLVAEHSVWHSRVLAGYPEPTEEELASRPSARHRIVHVHPTSGRKSLYIAAHIAQIEGMATADARALVRELIDFATQPQFVYCHDWRVGDLVMWDNFCTMHRGRPYAIDRVKRDLRRTTVQEVA